MNVRSIAACFCTVFLLQASVAAPPRPTVIKRHNLAAVIIPANSPVHFKGTDKKYIEGVMFEGSFVLSGKYHYGWDGALGRWRAVIEPDKAVAARLPSFEEVGGAREITIDNPQAFGRAVLSKAEFAKLKKTRTFATGRTTIRADNLFGYVMCGYPWYSARFLSVVKPAPVVLAKAYAFDAC